MNQLSNDSTAKFYAETYDVNVSDWPGEIEFYLKMAEETCAGSGSILELACGTGRVAIRLAEAGFNVVGLDHSPYMLEIARQKSRAIANIRWIEGNMADFNLDHTFALIIIPGHAFQNLNSPEEQVACLKSIQRHLNPGRRLIVHLDHQDVGWLGEIAGEKKGVYEPGKEFQLPANGSLVRASYAWSYEPATQTATLETIWEELDTSGDVINKVESEPVRLHCVFRFEFEHLLNLLGFQIQGVYGDFLGEDLRDESSEMVWDAIARGHISSSSMTIKSVKRSGR
jgi:ubiquinone/menaquinone biosynthesis C-methylase UbiE